MANYRYTLAPYKGSSSRYTCPSCLVKRCFVRYIDVETGLQINDDVGRCNHKNKCNYHYTPKQYFNDNKIVISYPKQHIPHKPKPLLKPTFIPSTTLKKSLKYNNNNFIHYLLTVFNPEIVSDLVAKYFIGSSKYWPGSTVFWQIDINGNIRTGKIMLYSTANGKRIKSPYDHINWVHSVLKINNFNLKQCLFGEHLLLTNPAKPIALVESEKTAIIASAYLPQFIWISTGNITGFTYERLKTLKNKKIIAFPDLGAYDDWYKKALSMNLNITVSDYLEINATNTEKEKGLDLADYLVKFDYKNFICNNPQSSNTVQDSTSITYHQKLLPPHTDDNKIFSQMAKKNPNLIKLADSLSLVNTKTNKPFQIAIN